MKKNNQKREELRKEYNELVKAVEELLGKPTEQPKETIPSVEDWSRDVESTAKALEGVDNNLLPEIIGEEGYLAKNGAPFMGGAEPALHKNIQEGKD